MYLLDTNVISELRKTKPHGAVIAWLNTVSDVEIFLSSVSLGEIQAGIEATREQDALKAITIEKWADQVATSYNILPLNTEVFRQWAKLMHHKCDSLYEDAMIAATALVHKLTVVTRNVRDFEHFGVSLLNPFDYK